MRRQRRALRESSSARKESEAHFITEPTRTRRNPPHRLPILGMSPHNRKVVSARSYTHHVTRDLPGVNPRRLGLTSELTDSDDDGGLSNAQSLIKISCSVTEAVSGAHARSCNRCGPASPSLWRTEGPRPYIHKRIL